MKIAGSILVNKQISLYQKYTYLALGDSLCFDSFNPAAANCIVVKYLRPEYTLLLPAVDLIISENGGACSHLALIALSEGKHIIFAPDCLSLPEQGVILLHPKPDSAGVLIEYEKN